MEVWLLHTEHTHTHTRPPDRKGDFYPKTTGRSREKEEGKREAVTPAEEVKETNGK